ncbi:MAG: LysM peptidoglycan-binding domain-containing protein, partial [Rhodothermales bacterium]|nr:LysM peptidoglycan-binding domain-containing protein [Rhodothermales bacterium]
VMGVSLGYLLSDRVRFSANFVDRTGQYEGQAITIRSRFEPLANSFVDLEFGDGGSDPSRSTGTSAAVTGNYDLFSYNLRHLNTGRGFPGRYQDYSNTAGSLNIRPNDDLTISVSYRHDDRLFQSTSNESTESISKYFLIGPEYSFQFGAHALTTSVKYAYSAQNTITDQAWSTRNEAQMRMRTDLLIEGFAVGLLLDVGRVNTSFLDQPRSGIRYGLSARGRRSRLNSSLYFERSNGASINRIVQQETSSIGAALEYDLAPRTEVGLNAFSFRDASPVGTRYSVLSTRLRHKFVFGHTAGLQANVSSFGRVGRTALGDVSVSYEIPLGIPALRSSASSLSGRVVDYETGEPLGGAVLRLGRNKEATNAKGEFKFRWDSDVNQYLFIDRTSIGLDRVPMINMPLTISKDNLAGTIEIPVARAGELYGVVQRFEFEDGARQGGDLIPSGAEPFAIVEARDDAGSYRTTADEQGRFVFSNLRPGQWTVRIVFAEIPDDYRYEASSRKHSVAPAGRTGLVLRTLPRKRNIKFVARGRVTSKAERNASAAQNGARVVTSADSSGAADLDRQPTQQMSPDGDSLQVDGRSPLVDEFVANRIRQAFEEALRAASGLDSSVVWRDRYVVVDTTGLSDCVPSTHRGRHEVATGESLASLARKYYCDPVMWPKIWLANYEAVPNPHLIMRGQTLVVPEKRGAVYGFKPEYEANRSAPPDSERNVEVVVKSIYSVQEDETLFGIAKRTMGSGFLWPRIWMVNRALVGEDTELLGGMELIIPGPERAREEDRVLFGLRPKR